MFFCQWLVKIVNINNHALIFGESDKRSLLPVGFLSHFFRLLANKNTGQFLASFTSHIVLVGGEVQFARGEKRDACWADVHPILPAAYRASTLLHNCSQIVLYLNSHKTGCSKRAQWKPAAQSTKTIGISVWFSEYAQSK